MHRRLAAGYAQPSAEDVLEVIKDEGRHYALYLRRFESEHRNITYDGLNVEVGSREAEIYARPIESLLIEMLREEVPLIALSNPMVSGPMGGAYRFESVPTNWQQFVSELLPDASLVVLHLTSLSGGILDELELLKNPSCSAKTVIIVGRNLAHEGGSDGRWFQRMLYKFDRVIFQQRSSAWSPREEKQFHSRLLASLQEVEHANQNRRSITRPGAVNFTLTTSYWPTKLWDFMKGPILGSLCLLAPICLFIIIYSSMPAGPGVHGFLSLTGMFVLMWIALAVLLGCLKGIDFIVDSAFKAVMRPIDQSYYKVQNSLDRRADSIRRSIANLFR